MEDLTTEHFFGVALIAFALSVVWGVALYNLKELDQRELIATKLIDSGASPLEIGCAMNDAGGDNPVCVLIANK